MTVEDRIMDYRLAHLVEIENESIREFVGSFRFTGVVLDYGCGRSPYRDLVESSADYYGFDRADLPGNMSGTDVGETDPLDGEWDAILCTQVIQFVPDVYRLLRRFRECITHGGALVLTGPTCWPEINSTDIHRHTKDGIRSLLNNAGFRVERVDERAAVVMTDFRFSLGYGAVARTGVAT